MKSRLIGLGLAFLFCGYVHAGDRFGYTRLEVPRTSYTKTSNLNVVISSVPEVIFASMSVGGELILRSVTITGVKPTTITFYDAGLFTNLTTTRASVEHAGVCEGGTIDLDIHFSSAIMYNKVGDAPAIIKWDYTVIPPFGGVGD